MAEPLFTDDDAKDISYCNVRAVQNDIAQGPARGTTTYLIKDGFKVRWHLARASRPHTPRLGRNGMEPPPRPRHPV
jgi:hypothetical protein